MVDTLKHKTKQQHIQYHVTIQHNEVENNVIQHNTKQ